MQVNTVIRCLTEWHKPKDLVIAYWFDKKTVEDIIDKPLTDDQWDIFVEHSEDYEIGEAIIEMNTFLEDTNENFNGGE
jgi:hypothetical protein